MSECKKYPEAHLEKGLSYSAIKLLIDRQPAGYKWQYIEGNYPDPGPARISGSALHCLVLEPAKFETRFAIAPEVDKRTKAGKEAWQALEDLCAPTHRHILKAEDYDHLKNAADALRAHPRLAPVFARGDNRIEQKYTGDEPESGVKLQAKPDMVTADGVIIEVKTCQSAAHEDFANDIGKYFYDVQASIYLDVLRQYEPKASFVWACVELAPPYLTALYMPDPEMLDCARAAYKNACALWTACVDTGRWPGYETRIKTIGVRPWVAKSRLQQREGE